ncbi:MAG: hypothetical protein K0R49_182 [Burkholderiales bacterium]|jgi:hypothetical protein|nr:hypothetical protein [Burkholderiales bacterium]
MQTNQNKLFFINAINNRVAYYRKKISHSLYMLAALLLGFSVAQAGEIGSCDYGIGKKYDGELRLVHHLTIKWELKRSSSGEDVVIYHNERGPNLTGTSLNPVIENKKIGGYYQKYLKSFNATNSINFGIHLKKEDAVIEGKQVKYMRIKIENNPDALWGIMPKIGVCIINYYTHDENAAKKYDGTVIEPIKTVNLEVNP